MVTGGHFITIKISSGGQLGGENAWVGAWKGGCPLPLPALPPLMA